MTEPALFRVDVLPRQAQADAHLVHEAELLGLNHLQDIRRSRYFLLAGNLDQAAAQRLGQQLLADPVLETASLKAPAVDGRRVIEVQNKPGVMDPVEASVIKGAADFGIQLSAVRVGTRIECAGASDTDCELFASKSLANLAIEEVSIDPETSLRFPQPGGDHQHARTEVAILERDDDALMQLSREGCLSLTLEEMQTVQAHFRKLGRNPTDVELESIAQTWSEHCVHKTLKGLVEFDGPNGVVRYDNLLKQTIAKVTTDLAAPWCISVFVDNSGIIDFDQEFGVCLKVETHNHPSAIDPYGGSNTGLGGVIRDILGTGLGAKPIFNTNVFCFGPVDLPREQLPAGCIHPRRLMHGVVAGVRDYGNRMGIPTVNGAVRFDKRYVGNPLVFCGTGGLIPRECCFGEAEVGDHILVIGGRTGRDGIHGATFSSIELSEESETVSSGAVQIGNAIQEKKVQDTFLQARDKGYFTATTDCGAGGVSSAIGEMGEKLGIEVHLERLPLKYDGLSYAEIWISEAQERMVAAVPEQYVETVLALFAAEDVEATDVGHITGDKQLRLFYHGEQVADLGMDFLHDGLPRLKRQAVYRQPEEGPVQVQAPADLGQALLAVLAQPNVASKEWVIRQYDHEVQAGSIVKPLVGAASDGPSDAAVVAPRLGRDRGVAVACGLNTCYGDVDAYHAAAAGMEESLRNLVCVGAPLGKVAVLDNFCWGNCAKPENLGSLVRACEACRDYGLYYGTPFISGKDSLNNEYAVGGETIVIPPTLLITAMTVMEDVTRAITMDLKQVGDVLILLGETRDELGGSEYLAAHGGRGGTVPRVDQALSKPVLEAVAACTQAGLVNAAHDCSDGGLAVTLAEMAFAGELGLDVNLTAVPRSAGLDDAATVLFAESNSRIALSVSADKRDQVLELLTEVPHAVIAKVVSEQQLQLRGLGVDIRLANADCKAAWQGGLAVLGD